MWLKVTLNSLFLTRISSKSDHIFAFKLIKSSFACQIGVSSVRQQLIFYYNSFRRRCSTFDVFFVGINEIQQPINLFTASWILQCDVFFFFVWFNLIYRMRFVCCNEKTQTNDKNKNIEFETEKRKLREIKTKKMSFDMEVTFPLSQVRWQGFEQSRWREQSKEHNNF